MAICPNCKTALRTEFQRGGIYYGCDTCTGRAVTVPQVRRVAGDRFATQLLRRINSAPAPGDRPCPFCLRAMRQFQIPDPALTLDSCRACGVVWFDPREFEAVPEGGVEPIEKIELRGREALALHKARRIGEDARNADATPEETWKWLPGVLGLPVELDAPELSRPPLATWGVSAVVALVSLLAFIDLDSAVQQFGFIPAEFWRYGGATFLTAFFLHGGFLHLASNLYFLFIFGDNVEDFLGYRRFGLLLLFSTLAGNLLHFLANPSAMVPCIGASGGISGVLAFYALKFPRVHVGFCFWIRAAWLQVPAWAAFAIWLALQGIGVLEQFGGFSHASALAHLGGVLAGVAAWAYWRKL
jgi:membrane associated rhomboid family serine protease